MIDPILGKKPMYFSKRPASALAKPEKKVNHGLNRAIPVRNAGMMTRLCGRG
jgi:hypothetical protein